MHSAFHIQNTVHTIDTVGSPPTEHVLCSRMENQHVRT